MRRVRDGGDQDAMIWESGSDLNRRCARKTDVVDQLMGMEGLNITTLFARCTLLYYLLRPLS
jgi:hypothetical protein